MKNPLQIILKCPDKEIEKSVLLKNELEDFGFNVDFLNENQNNEEKATLVEIVSDKNELREGQIWNKDPLYVQIEKIIKLLSVDFESLPIVTEGESKIIRRLTNKLVIEKFKPTVYSFSENRYGNAEGTDIIRARFSAEVFRSLHRLENDPNAPKSAFVALMETSDGPLTVQREVETSNLEVRVKRFHIGSPVHRYKYTERYNTTMSFGPLKRWSKFNDPIVCFDWRNPLYDENGVRLADEPISDDYAGVWMENVQEAKMMAKKTFLWLESIFMMSGFQLIDICFFIDRSGQFLFGEISPDCMRVREIDLDIENSNSFDKDLWRKGKSSGVLKEQYEMLFKRIFGTKQENYATTINS